MSPEQMKERLCKAVDLRREEIIKLGRDIFANPELGYRERRTAALVKKTFADLGLDPESEIAITGVRAELKGKESLTKVAVLGELDGLICPQHPFANLDTGAAHACGHNAQIAALLGLAMALADTKIAEELWGDVVFMAVPAEEGVEAEYERKLLQEGKIKYSSGKQNFIEQGQFDDIDLAIMFHSSGGEEKVKVGGSHNGYITKYVHYQGREAHSAGKPEAGINALNAALLGMMGIHAQRETFRDEDHIRINPIMLKGGNAANIIPADVRLYMSVRGANFSAVSDAGRKVDRALEAGALAVGATVEITTRPGYMPRVDCPALSRVFRDNAIALLGEDAIGQTPHRSSSTDAGDLSQLIPTIHSYVGGAEGNAHTKDYKFVDEELAYVTPVKLLGMTLIDLLAEEAKQALAIKESFTPAYSKETYQKMWDRIIEGKE